MSEIREENLSRALESLLEGFEQGLDGDFYVASHDEGELIKLPQSLQDAIIYATYILYEDPDEEPENNGQWEE